MYDSCLCIIVITDMYGSQTVRVKLKETQYIQNAYSHSLYFISSIWWYLFGL